MIQAFITFSNDVAAGTGNATLQSDVSVLNALLRMEDDASLQRAYLYQALASTPPVAHAERACSDLNQATEQQQADTSAFDQAATVAEQQTLNNTVAGPQVDEAKSAEKLAVATAEREPAAEHRQPQTWREPEPGRLLAGHPDLPDRADAPGQ